VVKVLKAGNCVVTVTATNLPNQPKVEVPVLVFGEITIPLPVAQVKITPGSYEMFKGEDKAFSAKAFNGSGNEVTGKTVRWSIVTTDSADGVAATIDQTGKVVANRVGTATVYAEIEGIVAQANININPDFAMFVEPFNVSIAPNKSQTFTLKTYQVDRYNGYFLSITCQDSPTVLPCKTQPITAAEYWPMSRPCQEWLVSCWPLWMTIATRQEVLL
jgi:hypothetical protein